MTTRTLPVRRPVPRRLTWLPELLVLAALWAAYGVAQRSGPLAVDAAVARGRALLRLETGAGIAIEHAANLRLAAHPLLATLAGYYYALLHFGVTLVVLGWLWLRHRDRYGRARTALVVVNVAALAAFWLAPTAPPRLLPGAGFVDTIVRFHAWGTFTTPQGTTSADQFASMPSLHVAWAVWCATTVATTAGSRLVRRAVWCYPACTALVVVTTGNHYVLDVAAGVVLAFAGWAAPRVLPGAGRPGQAAGGRGSRSFPVPPAAGSRMILDSNRPARTSPRSGDDARRASRGTMSITSAPAPAIVTHPSPPVPEAVPPRRPHGGNSVHVELYER